MSFFENKASDEKSLFCITFIQRLPLLVVEIAHNERNIGNREEKIRISIYQKLYIP